MENKIYLLSITKEIWKFEVFFYSEILFLIYRQSCWIHHEIHLTFLKTFHFWGSVCEGGGEWCSRVIYSGRVSRFTVIKKFNETSPSSRANTHRAEIRRKKKKTFSPIRPSPRESFAFPLCLSVFPRNRKCKSSEISSRISFLKVTLLLLALFISPLFIGKDVQHFSLNGHQDVFPFARFLSLSLLLRLLCFITYKMSIR